jgi:redox-sensitive bicupin YhaK (pirin superfamily)
MSPPRYQNLAEGDIPRVSLPGLAGTARVIAGEFEGTVGPAKTFTAINLWDVQISKAASVDLLVPDGHTTLIAVQSGSVRIHDTLATAVELAELERKGNFVRIGSDSPARLLLLTGEPIDEPVVGQGPFVMNTREEIGQAIDDYRHGRMGRLA